MKSLPYEEMLPMAVKLSKYLRTVELEPENSGCKYSVKVFSAYAAPTEEELDYGAEVPKLDDGYVAVAVFGPDGVDSVFDLYKNDSPMKYGCGPVDPRERFRLSRRTGLDLADASSFARDAELNLLD